MSALKIVRDALAEGDLVTFLIGLDADEHETLTLPVPGGSDLTVTYARIGRTQVAVRDGMGDTGVSIHVHEDEDGARECYRSNVERVHRVQAAAQDGPIALLMALATEAGVDLKGLAQEAPVPVSLPRRNPGTVPVREVAYDLPTGQYL